MVDIQIKLWVRQQAGNVYCIITDPAAVVEGDVEVLFPYAYEE